jgi:hypothetical protein
MKVETTKYLSYSIFLYFEQLILKKKLHCRDKKGLNVIKYEVKGQSKVTTLNAILFNDMTLIFGNTPPPTQNPHLNRFE